MGLNIRLLGHGTDGVESLGLGTFDGLHLGHQEILNHCTHLLNLYPHPARVLQRNKDLKRITTTRELRILHPQLLTLNFNKNIAQLHAKEFLEDIIWTFLKPKKIVVGYDYKFGRKKTGDIHYLKEWAKRYEIEVIVISPFKKGGRIVKSSEIRDLLAHGDFNEALELLGHDYLISGVVTSGDGRGKSIGFPTANLRLKKEKLVPGNGVFMGTVDLKEKSELALVYIGKKTNLWRNLSVS